MTERSHPSGGFHLQISKLLVVAVIIATAATGALVVTLFASMPSGQTPAPGPNGLPPPPPNLRPLAVISVVTGLFVLSWLAVLVVFARDQVLRQIRQQQSPTPGGEMTELLAGLRAEIAADRERDLEAMTERLADMTTEFGERRETDGYLHGMRTAAAGDPPSPEGKVRALRRNPPPR